MSNILIQDMADFMDNIPSISQPLILLVRTEQTGITLAGDEGPLYYMDFRDYTATDASRAGV